MGKENIILNSILTDTPIFSVSEAENPKKSCHGENQKHLLILTDDHFDEAQKNFLSKILSAVKHDLEKDCLYMQHPAHLPFNLPTLYKTETINTVLVFGLSAAKIGLSIQFVRYQPFQLANRTYLIVDDLAQIAADKNLKGALWQSLQVIFEAA